MLADLAGEVAGAPEELRSGLPGFDSLAALRMRNKLEARAAEEEDAFMRVPLSRDQVRVVVVAVVVGCVAVYDQHDE